MGSGRSRQDSPHNMLSISWSLEQVITRLSPKPLSELSEVFRSDLAVHLCAGAHQVAFSHRDRNHHRRRGTSIVATSQPRNLDITLPVRLTRLVGRERELAAICDVLQQDDVRLLTLTGPDGVGKTHLALQSAADVADDFPDGVRFVDLAPITEPELVASTIAHLLGVRDAGNEPSPTGFTRTSVRNGCFWCWIISSRWSRRRRLWPACLAVVPFDRPGHEQAATAGCQRA